MSPLRVPVPFPSARRALRAAPGAGAAAARPGAALPWAPSLWDVARQRSIPRIVLPTKLHMQGIFLLFFQRGTSPASLAALRGLQRSLLAAGLAAAPLFASPSATLAPGKSHTEVFWKAVAPSGHSPAWSGGKPWCDPCLPQGIIKQLSHPQTAPEFCFHNCKC